MESLSFAQNKRKKIKKRRQEEEKLMKQRNRPKTASYAQNYKAKNFRPVSGISTITKKSYGVSDLNLFGKSRIKSGKSNAKTRILSSNN